ncbi:hypothetical protein [Armatimonas rosea]|uniref:Uncharacterized protein n=1 Tax=Armatimonas rosea TaxID=685828 RepID=A0A7W9SW59_ARMRO|nr:hypothetical protein [Armatimonas rosea]MBB6053319.1 hypothetical protein [Armatimonas rosea]
MARTLLPASQRCPAQKAFADALCPDGIGAKDAATELYRLLALAQSIHDNPNAKEADLRLATDIVGAGHIVAHHLEAIRELSKGLPK